MDTSTVVHSFGAYKMVRGNKTGNISIDVGAKLFSDQVMKLTKQTNEMKRIIWFPRDHRQIAIQAKRIKITAQEILDQCI